MPLFHLREVGHIPGGISCVITAVDDPPGAHCHQGIEFRTRDYRITYRPPEVDFTHFLKDNEDKLKKILSTCTRIESLANIDIPITFHEGGKRQVCPENPINVFTDGSFSKTGNGGWAGIIIYSQNEIIERSGSERDSSSNRTELLAVVRTLEQVESKRPVMVHTDSRYVIRGAEVWIGNWERNGYFTALNRPVKNRDLWESISTIMKKRDIYFQWISSSTDNIFHKRCDILAREMSLSPV